MAELSVDALTGIVNVTAQNLVNDIAGVLPGLIAALLVFILGWVVAIIISRIFARILRVVGLENYLKAHRMDDALGTVKISDVLTKILKYYIILVFLQTAVSLVQLGTLSIFLTSVLFYAPALIAAVLVILAAVLIGEYVKEVVIDFDAKSSLVRFVARAAKAVIIYAGLTMGLSTAGFNTTLITNVFLIVLQALVYGVALAAGLAFGFGGQKDAQDLIGKWRKHLKV
ncbi:MAG: hypothetical protein ABID61_04230 [Candidatus Micrarchaeota archaeon]